MAETLEAPAAEPKFQPYVPPGEIRPEFTVRAVLLGGVFGLIFGAVTVYVGLRAGLRLPKSEVPNHSWRWDGRLAVR